MSEGAEDREEPSTPAPPDRGNPPESEKPAAEQSEELAVEPPRADRRLRLLPVWILLAGAAASGGAWAVMDHLVSGEPAEQAPVRLITAATEPYKVRPNDPGGLEIPDRDKLIYETLRTDEPEEEGPEQILPPPEEPVNPLQAVAGVAEEEAGGEASGSVVVVAGEAGSEAPEAEEGAAVPPESEGEAAAPPPSGEPEAEPAPIAGETPRIPVPVPRFAIRAAEAGPIEAPARGGEAGPVPTPAVKPVRLARAEKPRRVAVAREPAASAAASRFMIQLGASRARGVLQDRWETLWRRHETALARLNPVIVRSDRAGEGTWYRLRAGPFPDRASALGACERLRRRGLDCFVVVN